MKILRSRGQSYTTLGSDEKTVLARGLRRFRNSLLTPAQYRDQLEVEPGRLCGYLKEDYGLVIRQVISILDKVVRKPHSLHDCSLETYVDRTRLSVELWTRVDNAFGDEIRGSENGPAMWNELRKSWLWKIHPYARFQCDEGNPSGDKNAEIIQHRTDKVQTREQARGRWHDAFWRSTPAGKSDYRVIADRIWRHLFETQLNTLGDARGKSDASAIGGLVAQRGSSMVKTASDPRQPDGRGRKEQFARACTNQSVLSLYFSTEVAKSIFDATILEAKQLVNDPNIHRQPIAMGKSIGRLFGKLLHQNFGSIPGHRDFPNALRQELWAIHNAVRVFYQDLAKSMRFRIALAEGDMDRLMQLLPADKTHLLAILSAKARNAKLGSLIRLGKLLAHASDLPVGENDTQQSFEQRLKYLVTSDGQSEIKRNEALTRVWRTSVALSLRTLQVLAPPQYAGRTSPEATDVTHATYAKEAVKRLDGYESRLSLLFGDKRFAVLRDKSRKDIVIPATEQDRKEVLWALLRLGAEIRHRTNHFSTKRRLIKLLEEGALDPEEIPTNFDNRAANRASNTALSAFRELLDFDIGLRKEVILDEFRRLKVGEYVTSSNMDELYGELYAVADAIQLTIPKFMAVLRHAKALATTEGTATPDWLIPFGVLDLSDLSKVTEGLNHFRVGLLRQLYARGFASWLHTRQTEPGFVKSAVDAVISCKKQRIESYHSGERFYLMAESFAEELSVDDGTTLDGLFSELLSRAMSDDIRQTYRPKSSKLHERTGGVEAFRREMFALLFAQYLNGEKLAWFWKIQEKLPVDEQAAPAKLAEFVVPAWPDTIKPWHGQFYAWLYLVPIDEVALLRHQLRKTAALETKGKQEHQGPYREMDRLMGLYIDVSSAGFSGREHEAGLNIGETFYERPGQFKEVYSDDHESHNLSVPGTRRGLRDILRMGHTGVLNRIYEKHKVTAEEVGRFESMANKTDDFDKIFRRKNALAKQTVELAKAKIPNLPELKRDCEEYRALAVRAAIYNFQIGGARLTEHARLHQLMMRVLGRLADFTLMWERDRQYAFLALLARKLGVEHGKLMIGRTDGTIGINLSNDLRDRLRDAIDMIEYEKRNRPHEVKQKQDSRAEEALASHHDIVKTGHLPIWDEKKGYVLRGDILEKALLQPDEWELYNRFFVRLAAPNPLDLDANERRKANNQTTRNLNKKNHSYRLGKRQIRNDLAHYNVLNGTDRVNLTYVTNAVRSLLAYDRKLKNAVSASIAKIVAEDGLIIEWVMEEDRLQKPVVVPSLEVHLKYVRRSDEFDPRFALPQASVRYTSMVKALFDFESGGYRDLIPRDGDNKRDGELRYPADLKVVAAGLGITIPEEILAVTHPILPPDEAGR
jgi:hypothetical protein